MGQDSNIEWTTHTFNPWRGCTKVSAGCQHCYADTLSKRNPLTLGVWGPNGTRVVASEAAWKEPLKWDRAAKAAGERHRVFCASLADVFEDWTGPMVDAAGRALHFARPGAWGVDDRGAGPCSMTNVRHRLFGVIRDTPHLDWLLLTKRPENIDGLSQVALARPLPPNVWIGTSVEDQSTADDRIPHLLTVPAAVRFLSCEPLLGPVKLGDHLLPRLGDMKGAFRPDHQPRSCRIDWAIVGGESGPGARPCRVGWVRSLVGQCRAAAVPCFVKQLGENVVDRNDHFGGSPDFDDHWPDDLDPMRVEHDIHGFREEYQGADCRVRLLDRKGGDPKEWPADLRVREFPHVA